MQQRFLLQILLLAQHVSGHHNAHHQELKSIIQWLLPVVFRAVVFKLLDWCGDEGYVSGLQDAATFSTQCTHLATRLSSITTATTGQTIIGSETRSDLLMMGIKMPETC